MTDSSTPRGDLPATQTKPAKPTSTLGAWKKLSGIPVIGTRLFSAAVSLKAPYFRTSLPHLKSMEPGRAVATAPKWWGVQNHIGTFHAIAACNLAEFVMGMLCEASVPASHRWVPKSMTTNYQKISKGGLTATATADLPDFAAITPETGGRNLDVRIELVDSEGTLVQDATITCWITAKKKR
ncbi:hotdog fold domain-containing protein [uncultured Corynebacterium sp.]|uniref:hotdog fold domain-containing protein n=1 Tax=uncultured Corynebacterium sp. TaxID=159447 RepID=UPI0025DF8F3D|nr:hotdog fold domain-containing protein [uncultured Corynebacterium sp.]